MIRSDPCAIVRNEGVESKLGANREIVKWVCPAMDRCFKFSIAHHYKSISYQLRLLALFGAFKAAVSRFVKVSPASDAKAQRDTHDEIISLCSSGEIQRGRFRMMTFSRTGQRTKLTMILFVCGVSIVTIPRAPTKLQRIGMTMWNHGLSFLRPNGWASSMAIFESATCRYPVRMTRCPTTVAILRKPRRFDFNLNSRSASAQ